MGSPSDVVTVQALTKVYRVHERAPGLGAALRSLFKRTYKEVRAVEKVSFTIEPGERVGFLGPNGAGKTTTLKILSGLLHETDGEVRVGGFVPKRRDPDFLKRITLVMGQKQQLLWDLPPADTFSLNGAIYGLPRDTYEKTLGELEELLDLKEISRKPTRQLSLGERMKCELAAALLHRPSILFLDEPTIGLDVSMQLAVREFIRQYNERHGATVMLTSHYMDDVASLCPRVIVIDKGKLRYDGDLATLVRTVKPHKRIAIRFTGALDREALERVGKVIEIEPSRAVLQTAQSDLRDAVSHLLTEPKIHDLTIEDPPLEEVMRDLFARNESSEGEETSR